MKRRLAGFTLIELVMTTVLMGIIIVVIGRVMLQSYQMFNTAANYSEIDGNALVALERIVNDIHTIRSVNDITTIAATQLSFVDVTGTSVQYQLSGTTLTRNSQTLATGVQSLSFTYRDENGNTTSTPSAVRFIVITVTMAQGNLTASFSTQGAVRVFS